MEITEKWLGVQIEMIIGVDHNGVGGYHNEGGEDLMWHNILMIWQKKMTWLKLLLMPVTILVFLLAEF